MMNHHNNMTAAANSRAHPLADTSMTLWQVGEMVFGPRVPVTKDFDPTGVICFETPFGTVCVEINAAKLSANEKEAKAVTLQTALQEVLSRPRIKGICFQVCTPWGICFEVCP